MRTLEQMKTNAQRQLDGMTSNRDHMAKDVLWLADTVQRLEEIAKRKTAPSKTGTFGSAFDEIFGSGGIGR